MNEMLTLASKAVRHPHKVPPYVLENHLGIEFSAFGSQAIQNWIAKSYYRRVSEVEVGKPIWDKDWDLLIILDSCRPEWLSEGVRDRDYAGDVATVPSVGSHSEEWIEKTFTEDYYGEIEETIYITGNHFAHKSPQNWFKEFENVNGLGWVEESAVPPAHVVTDRAVEIARSVDWERCIVHYMQPHLPIFESDGHREEAEVDQKWQPHTKNWKWCIDGETNKEELERAFMSNLNYVLDEVDLLVENVEAPTAVITSDHGQALGENYLWSHRKGVKHPSMRNVPWLECSATDEETLDPGTYDGIEYTEDTRNERLKQLGYL
jgi:hypothetical protein